MASTRLSDSEEVCFAEADQRLRVESSLFWSFRLGSTPTQRSAAKFGLSQAGGDDRGFWGEVMGVELSFN